MGNDMEPQKQSTRYCRKCLLRDMDKDEYFQSLQEYIDNIEDEIKTPADEYERRLSVCKECERLLDGMCAVCGCYVELRAAVAKHQCPAVKPLW